MTDNNTRKYANQPRNQTRRQDYEVADQTWIKDLLNRGEFGTLGTAHKNQPFLTPVVYIYIEADHAIYFHTAQVGRTRANSELAPDAVFNISETGRILPDPLAVDFNIEYSSVTVFGKLHIINDQQQAERYLQALMNKYAPHLAPGSDYTPSRPEDLKRTSLYQLKIEDWSGKQQKGAPDHPGAYPYPDFPKK